MFCVAFDILLLLAVSLFCFRMYICYNVHFGSGVQKIINKKDEEEAAAAAEKEKEKNFSQ